MTAFTTRTAHAGQGTRVEQTRAEVDAGYAERPEGRLDGSATEMEVPLASIPPIRKAAIVLVSLEQSLASQLLAHLDRSSVEAVTWEIARLDRIDPAEQVAILEEFLGLGMRRLCFVFDDLIRMRDDDLREAYHDEDAGTWALALAGTAPPVRAKVMEALDGNTASHLGRLLEGLGPFRLSDTEAAQAEIADRFRRLYDQGTISLPNPSGREEVLV
jgi:flagellar motor switch protein FliG